MVSGVPCRSYITVRNQKGGGGGGGGFLKKKLGADFDGTIHLML